MSRRSDNKSGKSSTNIVDSEVSNLFSLKDKSQFLNALLKLRQKYKNDEDLVNQIQEVFITKQSYIIKSAKKFAEAIRTRYNNSNLPYHQLLGKARAHGKKHKLSESEFAEFQRIYEQEISNTSHRNEVNIPLTNLMKVLGNVSEGTENSFNINENDYRNLEEILRLFEVSKPLHAQVLLQSLQYEDCALQAVSGTFDRTRQNPTDHIHPVIVAMFLPSISTLNSHFLFSNMAGIVKSRYNGEPLTTRPDYELFYNLVTDPNDVVCDSRTPIADLLHRCNLQNQLWNSVLSLRNGQFYNTAFRDFVSSIDVCRLNKYDNPDLLYGRYDGTVVKRLLAAFSFRPTVITTLPITQVFANNPYAQNLRPTVTSVPMINIRLQQYANLNPVLNLAAPIIPIPTPLKFSDHALTQTQTFIEGQQLVQRISQVIYSREIMVFYVDRRAHVLQYANQAYNLTRLPTALAGFERINTDAIEFESLISTGSASNSDKFCLRSVVIADILDDTHVTSSKNDPRKVVVGSSTYVFTGLTDLVTATYNKDGSKHRTCDGIESLYHYSPFDVMTRTLHMGSPIYQVPYTASVTTPEFEEAIKKIETQGIIFIYQNYDFLSSQERVITY